MPLKKGSNEITLLGKKKKLEKKGKGQYVNTTRREVYGRNHQSQLKGRLDATIRYANTTK